MRGFVVAALCLVLTGCASLPAAAPGAREDISDALGTPVMPLVSGVYTFADFVLPTEPERDADGEPQRMPLSTHVVMQAQVASQSYGLFLSNVRFYEFDGEHLVLELYLDDDEAFYMLARVAEDGRSFEVLGRTCNQIPENFRTAQGITTTDCFMADARVLLRSLALMEPRESEEPIRFELFALVPDMP